MEYVSTAKWRHACAKPLRQAWNRWLVSRSLGEGWRLFSTFPRWVFQTCGYKNESCTLLAVEKLRNLLQLLALAPDYPRSMG